MYTKTPNKERSLTYFFLVSLSCYMFLGSLDLSGDFFRNDKILIKYLPHILAAIILFFVYLGYILSFKIKKSSFNSINIALVILVLMILVGGFLSILNGTDYSKTLIGKGVNVIFFFLGLLLIQKNNFIKFAAQLSVLYSIFCILCLVLWWSGIRFVEKPHILHEEVILCVIAYAYGSVFLRGWRVNFFYKIIPLTAILLTFKLSAFLIVLILLIINCVFYLRRYDKRLSSAILVWSLFIVFILQLGTGIYLLSINPPEFMPSGSPEVRLVTYSIRIKEFMNSPIYGNLFQGDSLIYFDTKDGGRDFSAHSDILDLLAFGGIVFTTFFIAPVLLLIFKGLFSRSTPNGIKIMPYILAPYISLLAFNPILNQQNLVYFFWVFIAIGIKEFYKEKSLVKAVL